MADFENVLRQKIGVPIENKAKAMGKQSDEMLQKLKALRAMSSAPNQPLAGELGAITPQDVVNSGMPVGGGGGGMAGPSAPLTFDAADQARAAQLQMLAPPPAEPDLSGYTRVPRSGEVGNLSDQDVMKALQMQADQDAVDEVGSLTDQDVSRFGKLKQQMVPQGPVEVSPDEEEEVKVKFQE